MRIRSGITTFAVSLALACAGCAPKGDNLPQTTPDRSEHATQQSADSKKTVDSSIGESKLASAESDDLEILFSYRNPANDGWTTEVINEVAGKQLDKFGDWLSTASDTDSIRGLVDDNVRFTEFRPTELTQEFRDDNLTVASDMAGQSSSAHVGVDKFLQSLTSFANIFEGNRHVHYKFKIVRVEESANGFNIESIFQADAISGKESIQVNAFWHVVWARSESDLKITQLQVKDYREVRGKYPNGRLFEDCTEAVLNNDPSFDAQIMKSTNHWRSTLQGSLGVDLLGHHGLAIGDANGDGLEDLFVCQPGGVRNRLYIQQDDGTVVDRSEESGLDHLDRSRAALFVDFDNDGDQDFALMVDSHLLFLENDGKGKFRLVTHCQVGTAVSLAAADYDLDGKVDVYVCGYSAPRGAENAPTPYHDANNGYRNTLLKNEIVDGNWAFADVTDDVGLDQNNERFTLSAAWEDFDNDGDQDLYVANDFGRNNLFQNNGGVFVDIAAAAGVEDISAGMGVTWGDYNQDGLVDIYVSNMFSSAGNRVAYQRKFRPGDDQRSKTEFQRHARGNSLFENVGDGTFRDVSESSGATMGRWAWSSLFCDINNDSFPDILVTNGLATNEDTKDL